MTPYYEAQLWLDRANDTLFASDFNLKNELTLAAVNRAYYSMFYCTTALLRTENIITKSHSGTLSKFGELFIKTNRIPVKYSLMLRRAFDYRQSCDYDIEVSISEEEAQMLVRYATEFYELSKGFLENLIQTSANEN
jgi:uncharacterized protein (UPF0332 family)